MGFPTRFFFSSTPGFHSLNSPGLLEGFGVFCGCKEIISAGQVRLELTFAYNLGRGRNKTAVVSSQLSDARIYLPYRTSIRSNDMIKEQEFQVNDAEKDPMSTTIRPNCRHASTYRPILTTLLILLCIPILLYRLFPSATDTFLSSLLPVQGDLCTQDIGNAHCCTLYLSASPCLDECRKLHVDRETLRLTMQYETCAEECLVVYNNLCTREQQLNS
ncbi:hypothetical protein BDW02DRAFT_582317 [Decorospora gaudefroyi]|uniref:Uncharacterized protein n=1 Tax=Decorospora gaudefroyi TaxID=184978 RepID=A0A6A5K290_9PLEO|nr:hypothetical protein BDW02DRAFT_582317 [Decorospora gaudefroyi]